MGRFGSNEFTLVTKKLDIQAEQRKLQEEKYSCHLKQCESENRMLEERLTNKTNDFEILHEKCAFLKKQLVGIRTENDILDMKLQAELRNTRRLSRQIDNLEWSKNEIMTMIYSSKNIEKLRQKIMSKRLY